MRRLILFASALSALLSIPACAASSDCEPSSETRQQLKELDNPGLKGDAARKAKQDAVNRLLANDPQNVFFQESYLQANDPKTEAERTALIDRFRNVSEQHGGDPMYCYLYASSLVGKDTPQAIKIGQDLTAAPAPYVRAYLLLAGIYQWGKFEDKAKVTDALTKYFGACPASLDRKALRGAQNAIGLELAGKVVPGLRARLEHETDAKLLENWSTVWNLEFKSQPPNEHAAVRQQISADLAKIQGVNRKPDAEWLNFLKDGYHIAGDESASKTEEARLLEQFPNSDQAKWIRIEAWNKAHPWPGPDEDKQKEYAKANLARAEENLKRDAHDEHALYARFDAHATIKDLPPQQLVQLAQAVLAESNARHDTFMMPPLEFQVARAYLKAGINVDQVPLLLDQGTAAIAKVRGLPSDSESESWKKVTKEGDEFLERDQASLLLDAAKQLDKPDLAKDAVAKVEAQKTDKPADKSARHEIEAKWAELQGRKLDSLLLYRAALDERPADQKPAKKDELAEDVDRLWKELGGTTASQTWLSAKPVLTAANEDGRWEKPEKDMKAWQLTDLNGTTWKLKSLEGKTVLVNVWATWCGPCKSEHPHLQKLYEQLKNDSNVQIVTFNIDEEIGGVAPYVKENNYTFPVLLAKDYADEVSVDIIPRNWIVDRGGKWQWEQIGFGSEHKWEDDMLKKLKEAK